MNDELERAGERHAREFICRRGMLDIDNPERSAAQDKGVPRVKGAGVTRGANACGVDNPSYHIACGERTKMTQARIGVIPGRERIGRGRSANREYRSSRRGAGNQGVLGPIAGVPE